MWRLDAARLTSQNQPRSFSPKTLNFDIPQESGLGACKQQPKFPATGDESELQRKQERYQMLVL